MKRIRRVLSIVFMILILSVPASGSTLKCGHPTQSFHQTSSTRAHQIANYYSTGTQYEWVYYLRPGGWDYIGVYTRHCFWA